MLQACIGSAVTQGASSWQSTLIKGYESLGTDLERGFAWDQLKVRWKLRTLQPVKLGCKG